MLRKSLVVLTALLFVCSAATAFADGAKAKELFAKYFDGAVKDLETITNIDSGTGDAEGSAKIAEFLKGKLEAFGATVELRANDKGTHVVAKMKGSGKLRLLLMAHTDTVFEKGEAAKRPFKMDDKKIATGPGVGDDKATVIMSLYAMQALKDLGFDKYGEITLYYAAEEETGSDLEDQIIEELAKQSDMCIVIDTARPNWGIVTQRKGNAKYTIEVEGISGHAGNAPHRSASAIAELANQICMLFKLASPLPEDPTAMTPEALAAKGETDHGQYIPENSINVGIISSDNKKTNVIAGNAKAVLEMRYFKMAEGERLDKEIKALATKTMVPGAKVTITGGLGLGPMEKTAEVQKLVDLYKGIVKAEYGADVVEWVAGGLTDGNVSAKFVPTIDALGVENADEHTDHETVNLNTFEPRGVSLVLFIQELSEKWPLQ